jgi:hypothetical protein
MPRRRSTTPARSTDISSAATEPAAARPPVGFWWRLATVINGAIVRSAAWQLEDRASDCQMKAIEPTDIRWHAALAVGAVCVSASAVLLGLADTTPATATAA